MAIPALLPSTVMGYTLPPPSAPSSPAADTRAHAEALIAQKTSIEAALNAQFSILKSHNIDMSTPLVDPAGFPRADIDIVAVRNARVRIIELRNDLNAVLEEVKRALEAVHAATASQQVRESEQNEAKEDDKPLTPFARIDGVAPGSPAASAGLQREDLILAFGSLNASALRSSSDTSSASPGLAPLAALASSHEARPLELKILRASQPLTLTLVPKKWGGRGLIGCHIVPYNVSS